jgi:hypothetical protein
MDLLGSVALFQKQKQKRIDDPLPIVEDGAKFAATLVTYSNDVSEWNGLSCQLGGDCGAKETILVKDADLAHIAGVISNGDIFPHVRGQDERKIS